MFKSECRKVDIYFNSEDIEKIDGVEKILDDISEEMDGDTEVVLSDEDYKNLENLMNRLDDILSCIRVNNN